MHVPWLRRGCGEELVVPLNKVPQVLRSRLVQGMQDETGHGFLHVAAERPLRRPPPAEAEGGYGQPLLEEGSGAAPSEPAGREARIGEAEDFKPPAPSLLKALGAVWP